MYCSLYSNLVVAVACRKYCVFSQEDFWSRVKKQTNKKTTILLTEIHKRNGQLFTGHCQKWAAGHSSVKYWLFMRRQFRLYFQLTFFTCKRCHFYIMLNLISFILNMSINFLHAHVGSAFISLIWQILNISRDTKLSVELYADR